MMTINMTGKPCPIPVVEAKKALAQPGTEGVTVMVDNIIAIQNLEKMASGLGYTFSHEQKSESEFAATILTNGVNTKAEQAAPAHRAVVESSGGISYMITCNQLGAGDVEASQKLLQSFLLSLSQQPVPPRALLLLNTGVKLAAEGTYALDELRTLAKQGTIILACGQCLTYYNLIDKLLVGRVSNMLEIVEVLSSSARSITV